MMGLRLYFGRRNEWRRRQHRRACELGIPVPYAGKRGRYRFLRHIATMAERRASEAARVDGLPYRAARLRLPSNWDDIPRTIERSWKAHRRTQYRQAV